MTTISRWISRAGFELRHGHGFLLDVRKIQTPRSQEFFNPFNTYIRLKSGADILDRNGTFQGAPRSSPYLITDY
ncbi:MAG TPA: hypothetical protein VE641_01470 [Chthoniobacterales bacterium]|jgi:hypothetical protein|nr:hypothetical protein [Chthoniobacterales bacterium]